MSQVYLGLVGGQEVNIERDILRLLLAAHVLRGMIDTPTKGLNGDDSKQAKVDAAYRYAELLMQG